MESTDLSKKGEEGRKSVKILADGTRVIKYKEAQKLPDGSAVEKTRTSRVYPAVVSGHPKKVRKKIKTTIKRTGPDVRLHTEITTEETISSEILKDASQEHGSNSTHTYALPDGSSVVSTKSTSTLKDGCLSTVATTVHVNHVESDSGSQDVRCDTDEGNLAQSTPASITSENESPLPPGYVRNSCRDNDAKLKASLRSPQLEVICPNDSAFAHSQYINKMDLALGVGDETLVPLKNVDYNNGKCSAFKNNPSKLESMDNAHEEPIPFDFYQVNTTPQYSGLPLAQHGKRGVAGESTKDWDDSKSHITAGTFDFSDTVATTTDNSQIRVAKAVDDEEDGPIHEATNYTPSPKAPFYKNWHVAALTFVVLAIISVVVTVAVVYSTKKTVPKEVVVETSPTLPPTTKRGAELPMIIERDVLKGSIVFSDLPRGDPCLLALDWIMDEDKIQLQADDLKLKQRFTLALLGFQFDYQAWEYNRTNEIFDESFDWLTGTDECEWFGVSCSDDGKVIGLELSSNNMIGEIPREIGNLDDLEELVLDNNCLFGTMPSEIGMLSSLQNLNLGYNALSGFAADGLFTLSSLVKIDLVFQTAAWWKHNCTSSDGNVVDSSYKMGDLDNAENIGFQGTFLERIGQLQHLTFIDIYGNSFTGYLTPNIGDLKNLEVLSAGGNSFGGTIPPAISTLSCLKELLLNDNLFSGPLPANIGKAKSLEVLRLEISDGKGRMNGTIPDSLYNLGHLKQLGLSGHDFEGEIKSEIGNLKELVQLGLYANNFSGTLPSELGLCEQLELIQIHHTNIEGVVPEEVCLLRSKNLNPRWPGAEVFTADCSPEDGIAFVECAGDCCNMCCEHTTGTCYMMDES